MKRRWTHISKDPSKAMNNPNLSKSEMWNLINHLPKDKVKSIVTEKILKLDQESCKIILEGILKE